MSIFGHLTPVFSALNQFNWRGLLSMSLSMYQASVPAFVQMLNNLSAILDKAEAHARDRKIDPEVLLDYRLAPDMLPFVRQIQIAADLAKGAAARLAGVEVPKHDDTEKTFADLKARLTKRWHSCNPSNPARLMALRIAKSPDPR